MTETFKIFLDRLFDGKEQILQDSIPKEFLFVDEEELKFEGPVEIKGKAYLAYDHLVIRLNAEALVNLPCVICTQPVSFFLKIKDRTHSIPIKEISGKIFSFKDLLKEELLLEVPQTKECNDLCKERKNIAPFLNKKQQNDNPENHFPFSGLE